MYGLECGHKFCKGCWSHYLTQKIVEEGVSQSIKCLEPNCEILVDDENIIMMKPEVMAQYQRSMTNDFVMVYFNFSYIKYIQESSTVFILDFHYNKKKIIFFSLQHNKALRWCPSADCLYAARKMNSAAKNTWSCKCGYDFCFDCVEYWHEPVSCARLNQWKNSDDSETRKWIAEHAKPCPQCFAKIEKNGGCHHMVIIESLSFCVMCIVQLHYVLMFFSFRFKSIQF